VEEVLAERSASIGRITRWVGAVNPLLEALGANPIRVTEAPSPPQWLATGALECRPAVALLAGPGAPQPNLNRKFVYGQAVC
jgi:hypothetical protein